MRTCQRQFHRKLFEHCHNSASEEGHRERGELDHYDDEGRYEPRERKEARRGRGGEWQRSALQSKEREMRRRGRERRREARTGSRRDERRDTRD
jgi:hypothetical protein